MKIIIEDALRKGFDNDGEEHLYVNGVFVTVDDGSPIYFDDGFKHAIAYLNELRNKI